MGSVRRSVERTRSWQAWAGTVDELRKVGDVARAIFSERQGQVADELYPDVDNNSHVSDADISTQFDLRYAQRERDRLISPTRFEATLESGADKVSGSIADVLPELDQRTVTAVKYEGSFNTESTGPEKLFVIFTWDAEFVPAVDVKAVSADHGWANKALAILSEELDKRKIWWAGIYLWKWRIPLFMLTYIAFYFTAASIVFHYTKSDVVAAIVGNITAAGIVCPLGWPGRLFRKIFPRCELLGSSGVSTTGSRRIASFASIIGTVILGIFVNIIS